LLLTEFKQKRTILAQSSIRLLLILCFAGGLDHRGNCTTPGGLSSNYSSQHFAQQISAKLPESYSLSEHV